MPAEKHGRRDRGDHGREQRQHAEHDEHDPFGEKQHPVAADRAADLIARLPDAPGTVCHHEVIPS